MSMVYLVFVGSYDTQRVIAAFSSEGAASLFSGRLDDSFVTAIEVDAISPLAQAFHVVVPYSSPNVFKVSSVSLDAVADFSTFLEQSDKAFTVQCFAENACSAVVIAREFLRRKAMAGDPIMIKLLQTISRKVLRAIFSEVDNQAPRPAYHFDTEYEYKVVFPDAHGDPIEMRRNMNNGKIEWRYQDSDWNDASIPHKITCKFTNVK
jgi:hypothetical protein